MEELIRALEIVQNDVLLLEYKLKTYKWNVVGTGEADLRTQLVGMINDVSSGAELLGEHLRSMVSPSSPAIDLTTIGSNSTIRLDVDGIETTYASMINKIKSDNSAMLQSLSTAKITAQELGNNDETVAILDQRISAHQAHAAALNLLNG